MKLFFLKQTVLFLSLCAALFLLLSCAARIDGSIAADGSASLSVNISLEQQMSSLVQRLSAAGGRSGGPVLDGAALSSSISAVRGVSSASLVNTGPAAIEGQIRISAISQFLSAADGRGFITFEQGLSGGRCVITINRENGPVLLGLLSPQITDYLNALMAPIATGEELGKTEYLEIITMFYNSAISNEIAGSRIRASLDFPGPVTYANGGTFSGRRVNYDIPLLDLLVLETPLSYEVRWN